MELKEQNDVLQNKKKNMLVSASAGSGKTYIMIKYICKLVVEDRVPLSKFLILTFTKPASLQMKDRLLRSLKNAKMDDYVLEQIDAVSTANISTIHAFCEKFLKKYGNTIGLNENFSLLDENMAQNIKELAFGNAYKEYEREQKDLFVELSHAYKNNKTKIKNVIFEIQNLAEAVAEKEEFLKETKSNFEKYFDEALVFLFEDFQKFLKDKIKELSLFHVDDFEKSFVNCFKNAQKSRNLFELSNFLYEIEIPRLPAKKIVGQEIFDSLKIFKSEVVSKVQKIKDLNLSDSDNVYSQRYGILEKNVLNLFESFERHYENLKKRQNCLDFSDLEKYMKELSVNEKLFEGLEYVFIDEYQDTNKIQEKIIKNIAKNCHFVAVGDLKQGIYGFRLASSEIFLRDQEEFQKDENSSVNLLRSNFRSSKAVLDFVNDVFKVCMTKENANVDYLATSMLEGRKEFVDDGQIAVNIDLCDESPQKEIDLPQYYSVKNAEIFCDNKEDVLLADVKRRINEVLESQISVDGVLRKANFGDIAILSRYRNAFFNRLEDYLQQNEIPVMSNSRANLLDEPEVKVLLNFLKLALCLDDEVALASVLLSGLFRMNVEEILEEKTQKNVSLLELVEQNESTNFTFFKEKLEEFRLNSCVFGIKKAFLQLFRETNYLTYINMQENKEKLNLFIENFLNEAEKFDFDIPEFIHYLETVDICVQPETYTFENCVTLTTIHDSKGLEYPIVFLINCDKKLSGRADPDVQINEKFGLALKCFDFDKNSEMNSVRMNAIRQFEKNKDFAEEMMIFYVALTRAQNRLYLFGLNKENIFKKHSVKSCESYFDFIFFALQKQKNRFLKEGFYQDERLAISHIENVVEEKNVERRLSEHFTDVDPAEKIENYLDFKYDFEENQNFRLKESVTSLSRKNQESSITKYSNDNFSFGGDLIEIGNAYHLALKVLDFEKICDIQTLRTELQKHSEIEQNLINMNTLYNNIIQLKKLTQDGETHKEEEFILKEKLSTLLGNKINDEVLVQGIVDLFVIKNDHIILVDYKYSQAKDDEYLISKYKNQLKLYKIAIENAFNLPVRNCFLLSLKQAKLIYVNI